MVCTSFRVEAYLHCCCVVFDHELMIPLVHKEQIKLNQLAALLMSLTATSILRSETSVHLIKKMFLHWSQWLLLLIWQNLYHSGCHMTTGGWIGGGGGGHNPSSVPLDVNVDVPQTWCDLGFVIFDLFQVTMLSLVSVMWSQTADVVCFQYRCRAL